jgi:hypothetical protein
MMTIDLVVMLYPAGRYLWFKNFETEVRNRQIRFLQAASSDRT